MAAGTNCTPMLARLIELVQQGRLLPLIDTVLPWTSVSEAAERLAQQTVDGKIILEIR